jgi:ABC-type uncharacterized transport system substrate-binding protein
MKSYGKVEVGLQHHALLTSAQKQKDNKEINKNVATVLGSIVLEHSYRIITNTVPPSLKMK